ncbi:MAG: erythromycin esterase family protein [Verrucomicrobiota bacterium]
MPARETDLNLQLIHEAVHPLTGAPRDYDPLMEIIGDARYVLLGEATHGTHEFYKARAEITKRLIREKHFSVIAWEADWPDALRVNRYIRGGRADHDAAEALASFERFPVWMWRNAEILDLVGWLRSHNESVGRQQPKVGVYGLDLYSLYRSMDAVIHYLERIDPKAAAEARQRYGCFEHFGDEPQTYGMLASQSPSYSCESAVVQELVELQRHAADFLSHDGRIAADELFFALQNARVAQNAERYYRAMYRGRPNTWNLRDQHMVDTLDQLMAHLEEQGENPKAIVWAHNSHLGDARATDMTERGELNVGQLVRERHGGEAVLVGFSTHSGTVTAASDWGGVAQRKRVRPGMPGSWEDLFHNVSEENFLLALHDQPRLVRQLALPLLQRAIGVIYRPETERWSHYFHARLSQQFDAVIHFDHTRAVEPLERTAEWDKGELPDTYPSAV